MQLVETINTYKMELRETLMHDSIFDAVKEHEKNLNMNGFSLMTMYQDESGLNYYLTFKKVY